ncbi:MAG: lipid-A-disaccharide synthase [Thiotrichales bacterium]
MSSAPRWAEATPRVLLVAGEASGDMHAANLARELRTLCPTVQLRAMGGEAQRAAGVEILIDNRDLAVVGIVEVLRHYPQIRRALRTLEDELARTRPQLLILVDYVEFNLKLAATAKRLGVPVLFYVSPQVWAWREHRVKRIGARVDMMAVIFPFEVKFYERHGIPVRYVGNPLVGHVKPTRDKAACYAEFGLDPTRPVVGLLPGSRRSEVSRLLPLFAATAARLHALRPQLQFVVPVAPGLDRAWVSGLLPPEPPIQLAHGASYDAMQLCAAILTASGTATLETALMDVPMALAYQVAPLSYAILRRLIKIPDIGLVNIVAGRRIVQEFVQHGATADAIAPELLRLLEDNAYRAEIHAGLAAVREKLGDDQGSKRVAALALDLLNRAPVTG